MKARRTARLGFAVVAERLRAAMLKRRLPDATSWVLGSEAGGGPSPARRKQVAGMAKGGLGAHHGQLSVDVTLAWK